MQYPLDKSAYKCSIKKVADLMGNICRGNTAKSKGQIAAAVCRKTHEDLHEVLY